MNIVYGRHCFVSPPKTLVHAKDLRRGHRLFRWYNSGGCRIVTRITKRRSKSGWLSATQVRVVTSLVYGDKSLQESGSWIYSIRDKVSVPGFAVACALNTKEI